MSELQEAYHEAMTELGDPASSWRTVFLGAAKRLNEQAVAMIAKPAKGSKLAAYIERLNPTMKAKLVGTYKPFRVGGVPSVTDDTVRGKLMTGEGDAQLLAETPERLKAMGKEAVIAEMMADPKVWLLPVLKKKTHARPQK